MGEKMKNFLFVLLVLFFSLAIISCATTYSKVVNSKVDTLIIENSTATDSTLNHSTLEDSSVKKSTVSKSCLLYTSPSPRD